ncbi:MAG: VOC family protein [Chloroflexota bacterium]
MTSYNLHHAGIVVPDLERAIEFYCDVFGYTVLQRIDWDSANVEWPEKVTAVSNSVVRGVQLRYYPSRLSGRRYHDGL